MHFYFSYESSEKMKKFLILVILLTCFVFNTTVFSAAGRVGYELNEVWDVGQIIPLRPNCDISYTILSNNGVAEYIQDGEYKGGIIFKKPGNVSADLLTQIENEQWIFRYNYRIVPKGSLDIETISILNFVNGHRAVFDIGSVLELDNDLNEACVVRAKELALAFAHIRPNGTNFITAVKNKTGMLDEIIAVTHEDGSNLWRDFSKVCQALIEEKENQAKVRNKQFNAIGIGHYYDASAQRCYWAILFGRNSGDNGERVAFNNASSSGDVYAENDRGSEAFPEEVLQLVNKERAKVGARPLRLSDELLVGAKIRAEEITRHFAHERPDGKSCFTVLRNRNRTLGENIAAGSATPEAVVDQWMHSPGHRANILNKDFKELGVGYCYKEGSEYGHYWIQMFRG